jgi:tetratricopeptide (TPR) repeat protein
VSKLWRKLRRYPAVFISLAVLGLAIALIAHIAPKVARERQVVSLVQQIDDSLRKDDWSAEHLQELDARIAALQEMMPEEAGRVERRLHDQFAESVRRMIREANDRAAIVNALELFAARDPEGARQLRNEYAARVPLWRSLFTLEAPFAQSTAVFDSARVQAPEPGYLTVSALPEPSGPVLTRIACEGNSELRAQFDASWQTCAHLGLVLNARGNRGYLFLLRPADEPAAPSRTPAIANLGDGPSEEREIVLEIRRDGVLLRTSRIKRSALGDGPLRLAAKRESDRLTFQVNGLSPVEFRDTFPLGSNETGFFGVDWPAGIRLQRLQASRQESPLLQSPLEKGDNWFAQRAFDKALEHYRKQAGLPAEQLGFRQEARYKEALCLTELGRSTEEIIPVFQEIAAHTYGPDSGEAPWPLRADCQLLLIYLERQETVKADAILEKLSVLYGKDFEKLVGLIPEDAWAKLQRHWTYGRYGLALRRPEDVVRDMERTVQITDLFEPPTAGERLTVRLNRIKAYRLAGLDREKALPAMEELVRTNPPNITIVEEQCWLLRSLGAYDRALEAVENALKNPERFDKSGRWAAQNLLVESARIHAARQEWDKAEQNVDEFFRWQERLPDPAYVYYSAACLVRGFLLERRQQFGEAQRAWQQGLLSAWQKRLPGRHFVEAQGGTASLQSAILGSLTQQLSDVEVGQLLAALVPVATGEAPIRRMADLVPPAVVREMWRTPRGRDWARRIAFRDLSFTDYLRIPLLLAATQAIREIALPAEPAAQDPKLNDYLLRNQEQVFWQLAEDAYIAYLSRKINESHVLALALLFKGNNASVPLLGWQALSSVMQPRLRGPVAYVFGQRYLRMKRTPEAKHFFRVALEDAHRTGEGRLELLAQAGLDRFERERDRK